MTHKQDEPGFVLAKFASLRKAYDPTKAIRVLMPDGTRKVYYEVVVDLYDTVDLTVRALTQISYLGASSRSVQAHEEAVLRARDALAGKEYTNAY